MTDVRRVLFAKLFDYAGVFPPAELPLEEARAEWERIQSSDDAWMANRFVVRAEHVELCGSEPLAIVDGPEETQGEVVYVEGETKLRCGGARVPSVAEVAAFIRRGVAFKATAGLHHALSTDDEFGFLNLLAACLWPHDAEDLLTTHDVQVEVDGFKADGYVAGYWACAHMRAHVLHSIGTCSFAEPREELRALGIL